MARHAVLLALGLLAALALPARAQSGCEGYVGVEPLFHRYVAMLEPRSDGHARAAAARVKLDLRTEDSATWLARQGLRPDKKGYADLAASVDSARALAELWLSGDPITSAALRGHAARRETMGIRLVESGCFRQGEIIQIGQNDTPLSASHRAQRSREMTLADVAAGIARQWQALREDPPPWWMLALYAALPLAAGGGLWFHLHLRRKHERRGYPRRIFTGRLTVAVEGDEFEVAAADIGRGGAKIHLHRRLEGAARVELRAAGLTVPALMSWQTSHFQGLSFLTPISRSALRAICEAAAAN